MQDASRSGLGELEHDSLGLRGVIAPQVGVAGPTSAVGVEQFSEGLIDLDIAACEHGLFTEVAHLNKEFRGGLDTAVALLTIDPHAATRIDALLAVEGKMVGELDRTIDYAAKSAELLSVAP